MTLTDNRPTRGLIKVHDGARLLAYASPANGGAQWAVWVAGAGPTDWSHTIAADSDAALVELEAFAAKAVT